MKRFGEYIREKREALQLDQAQIKGFNGPYISEIERGIKFPTRRITVEKLAAALHLDPSKMFLDWLWIYSLLDCDPREYFRVLPIISQTKEETENYMTTQNEISIPLDAPEQDIAARLGQPDCKFVVTGTRKNKWIYEKEGIHIIFVNNKVQDVIFK